MQNNLGNDNRPVEPPNQDPGVYDAEAWRAFHRGRRHWNRSGPPPGSRLVLAILLIVLGAALFLDNVGLFPIHNIWNYWPVVLVGVGVSKLVSCRTAGHYVLGILLICFGSLFLLSNLGILHVHTKNDSWPISMILITVGFAVLIKTLDSRASFQPRVGFRVQPPVPPMPSDNELNEHTVFGSIKRRLETPNFLGGRIESIFGYTEIDLRHSQISFKDKPIRIDINCVFGGAKIRIPDTWVVNVQAASVLGSVEDRTIPPRTMGGIAPPVLLITGQSVFGGLEVEN
jgi:predicted membrane protein